MVIGINTINGAMKFNLAERLVNHFKGKTCAILYQEDYINSGYIIPPINGEVDWETPESIDFSNLRYDFIWLCENVDIVILEGKFPFHNKEIDNRYDKRIFINADYETFTQIITKNPRWSNKPDWYLTHMWESYKGQSKRAKDLNNLITIDIKKNDLTKLTKLLEAKY